MYIKLLFLSVLFPTIILGGVGAPVEALEPGALFKQAMTDLGDVNAGTRLAAREFIVRRLEEEQTRDRERFFTSGDMPYEAQLIEACKKEDGMPALHGFVAVHVLTGFLPNYVKNACKDDFALTDFWHSYSSEEEPFVLMLAQAADAGDSYALAHYGIACLFRKYGIELSPEDGAAFIQRAVDQGEEWARRELTAAFTHLPSHETAVADAYFDEAGNLHIVGDEREEAAV